MIKRLQPFILLFILLGSQNIFGQDLEASWGKLRKVKKTSFVPYFDFAGSTDDKILVVHYGKKGIVFDVFNKTSLDLVNSIPLKLKNIKFGKSNFKQNYHKALLLNDKIYLFVYLNTQNKKENVEEFPLYCGVFDFNGTQLTDWARVGSLDRYEIKFSSYDFFTTVPNNVIVNYKYDIIVLKQQFSENSKVLFYDKDLNKIDLNIDFMPLDVLFSDLGRIWLLNAPKEKGCVRVAELDFKDNKATVLNEVCIEINNDIDSYSDSLDVVYLKNDYSENISIINEKYLQILSLDRKGDSVNIIKARLIDIKNGKEAFHSDYYFTESENKNIKRRINIFSRPQEAESRWGKDFNKPYLVPPNHILSNIPFFAGEVHSISEVVQYIRSGNSVSSFPRIANNYGDIFTFSYDTLNKKIIKNWITKRQRGGPGGEGDMFMSFIPFEYKGNKFYVFVGDEDNFAKGGSKEMTGSFTGKVRLGYYSIDKEGEMKYEELINLLKEMPTIPRMNVYHYDSVDGSLYLISLGMLKNKIKLIKISQKS